MERAADLETALHVAAANAQEEPLLGPMRIPAVRAAIDDVVALLVGGRLIKSTSQPEAPKVVLPPVDR